MKAKILLAREREREREREQFRDFHFITMQRTLIFVTLSQSTECEVRCPSYQRGF